MEGTVDAKIYMFLLHYWVTPHSTTGVSPSELLKTPDTPQVGETRIQQQ
jgi:hypothetical protein